MVRTMFAKLTAGAIVSLAMLAWTSQADAFGHRHHRGYGSGGGSWGSSGGSSGGWGSSGGSSGGWGSSGGSWGGGGHHGRHWRWHGSSGGSSGGWGSSGGSWGGSSGGWGSSGGSSGGWGSSGGSSGGTYYYSPGIEMTPVDPSMAPPAGAAPAAPAPAPGTTTSNTRADGLLSVNVPQDAKVFVNGQATTSTGESRQYVSRDLNSGFNYTYEVRAEVVRDGRTVEQVKKIDVRAGETANLAFDFAGSDAVETSLTVHVPADAKVILAGNTTKASGETRIFRTTGLNGGKTWDGYVVRVELERGGRVVTKEETISIKPGQSQELRFDFDGDKIASAR
jgi:uncharacterized protein (TIGR03000 family)